MRKVLLIFTFVTIAILAFAGPVQELMKLAETAFSKGNFEVARGYYIKITELESATPDQKRDARYNINVCQRHIEDIRYNAGYRRAYSLFKDAKYVQSRSVCYGLLKYGKYKAKTQRLISLCNDSIVAANTSRLTNQQRVDSINTRDMLNNEYVALIDEAKAYYDDKLFLDAIEVCKKTFDSKFQPLKYPIPSWYQRSIDLYQAQLRGEAITPELAFCLNNAIEIGDFNSGVARIITRYGDDYNSRMDTTHFVNVFGKDVLVFQGVPHNLSRSFSDGYLTVEGTGYFDTEGNFYGRDEIITPNFVGPLNEKFIHVYEDFSDGMAPVMDSGGKWGYLNKDFIVVIKPRFDFVSAFCEDRAFVREGGKWSIIDKGGNMILSKLLPAFIGSAYDSPQNGFTPRINWSYYSDGKIWVQTSKYNNILVDKEGKTLLSDNEYKSENILHNGYPLFSYEVFNNGLILYRDSDGRYGVRDLYGFMDQNGNVKISPKYELAHGFKDGIAPVKVNGKWGFIDCNGTEIITPTFDDVSKDGFSEGFCAVKIGGKWGYVDKTGNLIIDAIYDTPFNVLNGEVGRFCNGFAAVALNGQLGYVDKYGNSTFDYQ